MHVGDKVRLIHGHEEGIITKILPNNIVEVEIEDGFVIPVLKKEVALVAKEESVHFKPENRSEKESDKKTEKEAIIGVKGIYFSFVIINEQDLSLHLVNNTDFVLLYSITENQDGRFYGIANGTLSARGAIKIKNYPIKDFEKWPIFLVQFMFHRIGFLNPNEPITKSLKLKAATFHKKKGKSPVIDKEGYIIQLDEDTTPVKVDPEKLKDQLMNPVTSGFIDTTPPPSVIDLHIEKLISSHKGLSNDEILKIQMNAFKKALDQAIISGLDEITFIHGVGNGILKLAIQKEVAQMKNIKYYKDAMKEKFGYGATTIKIK